MFLRARNFVQNTSERVRRRALQAQQLCVFVLTGVAAHDHAGPAVVVSYLVAALAALLSGLAYCEFVVDQPVAGGAFNMVSSTFGELAGWVVACNMILEYTLSVAAVARGFRAYGATLLGLSPDAGLLHAGPLQLDFSALALVLALSAMLAASTADSAAFNAVVTGMNLVVIAYILCAGLPFGRLENLAPFAPSGARGVFGAASVVFFAFIGFDTVACAAEETRNPARDLPIGIVGSLLACSVLYAGLALTLCLMVPAPDIDMSAPFSTAFLAMVRPDSGAVRRLFLVTSARFVSFGAVTGIVTSLLVSLLGQARIYVVLGREGLLPPSLAELHTRRATPVRATWLTGASAGALALVADLETLATMVSVGALFVFLCVSAGVLWRRYRAPAPASCGVLAAQLISICVLSLGTSLAFTLGAPPWAIAGLAGAWLAAVGGLALRPVHFRPEKFRMPLSPLTPSAAILATVHLLGSLGWPAYARFGGWMVLSVVVYCCYSVHGADAHQRELAQAQRSSASEEDGDDEAARMNTAPRSDALELAATKRPRAPPQDPPGGLGTYAVADSED
ncbi:hypothetical protein WJX81_003898 [Elliptochloris bilobata]|uniref:Cationic amino acid transporter C-terminal domain-containing protein n=1 Tax=Elliptochloris bilobata TaxID=381761 RepID=A0AAW1QDT2_9CHLO